METVKDKKRLAKALRDSSCFELFPKEMGHYALLQLARPGEILISQGSEPENLLFLVRGRCSVSCVLPNGKEIILSSLSDRSLIGEIELISPERSSLTVQALTACELLAFPMSAARSILLEDAAFLRKLCVLLGKKEAHGVQRFFAASGYPLENRLAAFILEQREGSEYRVRKNRAAQSLGVSYRHLETVLGRLVQEGILTKNRFVYHIEKEEVLRELAGEILKV